MTFPEDFTWGVATSSYQIEGAFDTDGRGPSIWDTFSKTPGKVIGGETGDVACDHYNRYPQDIALMKELGVQSYRFSLAWPRMFPTGDRGREQRGFDFYDRLIDTMLEHDIKPFATLYHWDMPQPLQDKGGWANRDIVGHFTDYATAAAEAFGDRVTQWGTINEPWCVSWLGYMNGVHAPGVKNLDHAIAASHHTALAHAEATRALRAVNPAIRSGEALNMTNYRILNPSDNEIVQLGDLMDAHINRWWIEAQLFGRYPQVLVDHYGQQLQQFVKDGDMERVKIDSELLGINYYSDSFIDSPRESDQPISAGGLFPFPQRSNGTPPEPYTDMGWPVTPNGLYDLLMRIHRDYPQIPELSVTENGAAYDDGPDASGEIDDVRRVNYLRDHIAACARAVADGAPLKSYYEWSFMDNFEWAEGYAKRFGIVHVDFETQARTLKNSAKSYSAIIESNGASLDAFSH